MGHVPLLQQHNIRSSSSSSNSGHSRTLLGYAPSFLSFEMIKSWQFRNNTVQPSSPSTTPSTFKHLIPSISLLNFPLSTTTTTTNNNSKPDDSIEGDSSLPPPPPLFDCNDSDLIKDTHSECPRAIRPVQILTERLEGWQLLVKQLYDYFGQLAATESQVAKAYERMNHFGQQNDENSNDRSTFLGSHLTCMHGIRRICMAWETHHVDTAKGHAMLSNYLEMHVIPTLATMKRELKSMIRSVHTDDRLCLSTLAKMRREARKRLQRLERQLSFFEQYPQHGHAKQDPWLVNAGKCMSIIFIDPFSHVFIPCSGSTTYAKGVSSNKQDA